jgi:hypothetical protein
LNLRVIGSCPACAGRRQVLRAALDADRQERYQEFSRIKYGGALTSDLADIVPEVMQCSDCGHCWYRTQPDLAQLGIMYSAARKLGGEAPTTAPAPRMIKEMRRIRSLLPAAEDTPSLLDFGAGAGRWSRAAVVAGFQVVAFEPSATRSQAAQEFETVHSVAALLGRKFLAVQLEQVLEHVQDPVETLGIVRDHCAPGAVVRITVPNIVRAPEGSAFWDSWPFDGKGPHTLAPYEHLHGFTPRSLDRALARAGFIELSGPRYLTAYPVNYLRGLAAALVPRLGSTLRIVTTS